MFRSRRLLPFLAVLPLAAVAAPAAHAAPPPAGGLVQLAPPGACFGNTTGGGCSALASGMWGANGLAITPDGHELFAVGGNGGGAALDRDADGTLHSRAQTPDGNAVAVAPDGSGLLVGERESGQSRGAVRTVKRDPATGVLSPGSTVADPCAPDADSCDDNGLNDVQAVAVSPDGLSVYSAARAGGGRTATQYGGALVAFARNPTSQAISLTQCVPSLQTASGVCSLTKAAEGVGGASDVVVSPDGAFVYVAGDYDSAVTGFNRVTSGKGLGKLSSQATCVTSGATTNACVSVPGLHGATGLAISPDGRDLYVASFNAGVAVLRRDRVTGVLTETECFTEKGDLGCSPDAGLIAGARHVSVSPDGTTVHVVGGNGADGFVRSYTRDAATGRLTPAGCLSAIGTAPCGVGAGLKNTSAVVVSPDSRHVYTSAFQGADGSGAISAFAIETAPSCAAASVNAAHDGAVTLPLTCTDADGEPLTRTISAAPAHGTLGAIDEAAGAVSYTPAAGYAGQDHVSFSASDGTNSAPARTVTIDVAAAPAATPSGETKQTTPTTAAGSTPPPTSGSSTPGTQPVVAPPARDRTAPRVTAASLRRSVLRATLSEPASVTLTVERRRGRKYVAVEGALRLTLAAGTSRRTLKATPVAGLKPGRYRATVVARDAAGNASAPLRLTFVVTRAKG